MRHKELQDEEERMLRRQETSSSSSLIALGEVEDRLLACIYFGAFRSMRIMASYALIVINYIFHYAFKFQVMCNF